MKNKKILISIVILIAILILGTIKVEAASAKIEASTSTAEVGAEVTITAKFTAAAWHIKVSGNGITVHNQFPLEGSPIDTNNKIIE